MRRERHCLLGGRSASSGRWPSRVWMTMKPPARNAASTRLRAGRQAAERVAAVPGWYQRVACGSPSPAPASGALDGLDGGARQAEVVAHLVHVAALAAKVHLRAPGSRGGGGVERRRRMQGGDFDRQRTVHQAPAPAPAPAPARAHLHVDHDDRRVVGPQLAIIRPGVGLCGLDCRQAHFWRWHGCGSGWRPKSTTLASPALANPPPAGGAGSAATV